MISTKKRIIVLSTIICLSAVVTVYIVFRNRSDIWWHTYPDYSEVYEWKDPDSQEAVIRAVSTKWTDDTRKFFSIMFKQMDGTIWYVHIDLLPPPDPNSWVVCRGSPRIESKVALSKMQSISVGTAYVGDWLSIDQLHSGSDRK